MEDLNAKKQHFEFVLDCFIERLKQDRYVLGAVLLGSLSLETIWHREALHLWIIEEDGVTRRVKSDGNDEHIFRSFAEEDINIHAEIIPRNRFKRMVEGNSRTAFHHNFFAKRTLLYSHDESIIRWFEDANRLATKDQQKELLVVTTYALYGLKELKKIFYVKQDFELAYQDAVGLAHCLAAMEIVLHGEICETEPIYKALEYNPELFKIIYSDLLEQKDSQAVETVIAAIGEHLDGCAEKHLQPVLSFLKKQNRIMPLSQIGDYFAYTQLYPWHLETACEWLAKKGIIEKLAAPFAVTNKSRVEVEEPAYFYDEM